MSGGTDHNVKGRSAARLACVQALYKMEVSDADANEVIDEFISYWFDKDRRGAEFPKADIAHFTNVVRGVVQQQADIDQLIDAALTDDWALKRLDKTLRALLRAGTYELIGKTEIPVRVVIDEYLEIAHAFFEESEPSFANGVLDNIARRVRASELSQD